MTIKNKTDGGPAFPYTNCEDHGICGAYGMSLRDWMAGMALSSGRTLTLNTPKKKLNAKDVAKEMYEVADAMLKEREK